MFEKRFIQLLSDYPDAVEEKKLIIALLRDFFPTDILKVSILATTFELGITNDIKNRNSIDDAFFYRYTKRLVEECGISTENAAWGVNTWCTCYGCSILGKECTFTRRVGKDENNPSTVPYASTERVPTSFVVTESGLTQNQERAVKTNSNRVVVVAGPGSGKTRVITERIGYLVEDKEVIPERILAITFTSKAANEMRKRVSSRLPQNHSGIEIRTFHSFGLKLLREYGNVIGLSNDFEIASSSARDQIIERLVKKSTRDRTEVEYLSTRLKSMIVRIKNGIHGGDYRDIFDLFNQYNNALRSENLIDLDDMIYLPVEIFRKSATLIDHMKSQYDHILIDEFQDVNDMQASLLPYIIGPQTAFFFVGDDDQCIYEWRGAKPTLLKKYAADARSETIRLEDNFRSDKSIVALSESFISHNSNRIEKRMSSRKHETSTQVVTTTAKTQFLRFSTSQAEAEFCSREIKRLVESNGCRYDEIAVLLRSSKMQGDVFKDQFTSAHIPFTSSTREDRAYDDFLRVLQTISNFSKKGNLAKAINFPTRIMDAILFSELKEKYRISGNTTEEQFFNLSQINADYENSSIFRARYDLLRGLRSEADSLSASDIISRLINYYEQENQSLSPADASKVRKSLHILEQALEYERVFSKVPGNLRNFLDHIYTMLQDETEVDIDKGAVNIITCHKAKGLEFPVVFIPGVQVGIFPNDYFIKSEDKLEEERRLFYVSMTRAMDLLYVTCFDDPLKRGMTDTQVVKSFITEIPGVILNSIQ